MYIVNNLFNISFNSFGNFEKKKLKGEGGGAVVNLFTELREKFSSYGAARPWTWSAFSLYISVHGLPQQGC